MKIGLIGYGYWGPNLLRNCLLRDDVAVTMVADNAQERLALLKKTHPSIQTFTDGSDIARSSEIDAVIIATPVQTHYELAKLALENGKHVLVEKPLALNVRECESLRGLAEQKKLTLMVDHTFVYSGAVAEIKRLIDADELGKLDYFDSARINLGLFQSHHNVLWDLAPHDISILLHITGRMPESVFATGASHTGNGIEDIAYLSLKYSDGFLAHINASWISPVKIRQIMIGGSKKMIVYNDVEPTEKIKVYESGFKVRSDEDKRQLFVDYRVGDIFIPKLDTREPLSLVVSDFVHAIQTGTEPRSNAEFGINIVRVLEAADRSLKEGTIVSVS